MAGARADPGYCLFLAERILALLPRLRDEFDGVRRGGDIECVHRMRVTSRRLRAVLPLLTGCAERKELRRWRREVRSVTRALGAARDTDVQIDHLLSYAVGLPGGRGEGTGFRAVGGAPEMQLRSSPPEQLEEPAPPPPVRFPALRAWLRRLGLALNRRRALDEALPAQDSEVPGEQGVECLLLRLGQEREALQPAVLAALDRLEASGVLAEMAGRARGIEVRARQAGALSRSAPVYGAAHLNAALRCDELLAYAPALRDPVRAADHHAMRIAAKRLRYTLEIFAPLFDDGLKSELRALKRLQEALGELHDCDVWIARLPGFLEQERGRTLAYFGNDGFFRFIEPGMQRFLADRSAGREGLHAAALTVWEGLERDRYVERLLGRLAVARDEASLPPPPLRPIAEGTETARIALIADVHGNLPALEAVARDAAARGAQAFINAGDSVGHGGDPDGVVRRLTALGSVDVRGEWDRKAVRAARKRARDRPGSGAGEAARTAAAMDPVRIAYLEGLPSERRFALRGTRFLVAHRSPAGGKQGLPSDIADADLAELAALADADVVIVGHTHRPFVRAAGPFLVVNPGSVGRAGAEGGGTMAEYALLQLAPFDLCLLRVPYGGPGTDRIAPPRIEAAREGG